MSDNIQAASVPPEPPTLSDERAFEYLLNAMESAGQAPMPALEGYGEKRKAVLAFVAALRAEVTATQTRLASLKRYGLANGMQRFTDGQWVLYDDVIRAARSASGEPK